MPPSITETLRVTNSGSFTLLEDWSASQAARVQWEDEQYIGRMPPEYPRFDANVLPDDGVMGSSYLHYPDGGNGIANAIGKLWLDPAQDWTLRWVMRVTLVNPASYGFGTGVLYSGEGEYNGWTVNWSYGIHPDLSPSFGWGKRMLVEIRNSPLHNGTYYGRMSADNGATWDAEQSFGLAPTVPFALWFGGAGVDVDIGQIWAKGRRCWGAIDHIGWINWERTNAIIYGQKDTSSGFGGVYGHTGNGGYTSNNAANGIDVRDLSIIGQPLNIKSPIIGLEPGASYRDLLVGAPGYNPNYPPGGGYIKLYVRDAVTDALIPSSRLPGNEEGTLLGQGTADSYGRRISLAGIPTGTQIYLEVEGQSSADWEIPPEYMGVNAGDPHLQHAFVTFAPAAEVRSLTGDGGAVVSLARAEQAAGGAVVSTSTPFTVRGGAVVGASPLQEASAAAIIGVPGYERMLQSAAVVQGSRFVTLDGGAYVLDDAGPVLKRWNGSAWERVDLKWWNGMSFNAIPIRRN